VADSEGSSIRAVPFDPSKSVRTIVGTATLPFGRLFTFGDQDGDRDSARLQHPLGVAYHNGQIFVADTYNNKVKVIDAQTGAARTIAGTGRAGHDDTEAAFDEPAGISYAHGKLYVADTNNHAVRIVDLSSNKIETCIINGLAPPRAVASKPSPSFAGAKQVKLEGVSVKPTDGQIKLAVKLELPAGWKINELAPMAYLVEATAETGPIDRAKVGQLSRLDKPAAAFEVYLPVTAAGNETMKLSLNYYYCQTSGEGLCKLGTVAWTLPLTIDPAASSSAIELNCSIK
jgi:hypothetical protein